MPHNCNLLVNHMVLMQGGYRLKSNLIEYILANIFLYNSKNLCKYMYIYIFNIKYITGKLLFYSVMHLHYIYEAVLYIYSNITTHITMINSLSKIALVNALYTLKKMSWFLHVLITCVIMSYFR